MKSFVFIFSALLVLLIAQALASTALAPKHFEILTYTSNQSHCGFLSTAVEENLDTVLVRGPRSVGHKEFRTVVCQVRVPVNARDVFFSEEVALAIKLAPDDFVLASHQRQVIDEFEFFRFLIIALSVGLILSVWAVYIVRRD